MRYLLRFLKLPLKRKMMYMEAYLLLGFSRLLICGIRFKSSSRLLGTNNAETEFSDEGIDMEKAKQVAIAVRTMSRHTFWESKCLVQAYTAKLMLNRRKQKSTVYLGLSKNENRELIAHAWVRCGKLFVTGGDGSKRFTITSKFS